MNSNYLVAANFELGDVPSGVFVCRALNKTKLRLVSSVIIMDVERYLD
jgi:hypothetical protein